MANKKVDFDKGKNIAENAQFMHNYVNLCKIIRAKDPIFYFYLCPNMPKTYEKFHVDLIISF